MKYKKFILKNKAFTSPQVVKFTKPKWKFDNRTGELNYAFNPTEHTEWGMATFTQSEIVEMFISGNLRPLE